MYESRARIVEETIAYCILRGTIDNPVDSLRTIALRPEILTASQMLGRVSDLPILGPREEQDVIARIAPVRAALLRTADAYPLPIERHGLLPNLAGGRLLICRSLEMTLLDGASEAISQGFFDGDDLPPWDTWLWYSITGNEESVRYLLAWIPPIFLDLAEKGVDCNYFGCFEWVNPDDSLSLLTAP